MESEDIDMVQSDNESSEGDFGDMQLPLENDHSLENEDFGEHFEPTCLDSEELPPFSKLIEYLNSVSNMELNVAISVREILFMVLSLVTKHSLSLTMACDLMNFLNVMLGTTIFPASEYMFKNLFNSNFSMTMHFCCEFCGHYLGKSGDANWELCCNCDRVNSSKGYRYENTFITTDVKSQLEDVVVNCHNDFECQRNMSGLGAYVDFQSGAMYAERMGGRCEQFPRCMSLTFNADGAQISKDRMTVTPISVMINELNCRQRRKNVILAGLWYGKVKPRFDVFMKPFVSIMNDLESNGLSVVINGQEKNIKFIALCCCVDSVARAPLQGIKLVNGYHCCSWCTIKGEFVEGTVKYTVSVPDAEPRSEVGLLNCFEQCIDADENNLGVQAVSPLLNLSSFNVVWGFVPDYMHQVLLGVVKRCTENYMSSTEQPFYIGSPATIDLIDRRIAAIKVPHAIKRQPMLLSNRKFMKAKDWEVWFLFVSVPVLDGILPTKFLAHWKLLVKAIGILLQDVIPYDKLDSAELMLVEYVHKVEKYFGKFEMTYNVHQLLHLAESVRKWGPLWSHTAFPFESDIGNLKKIVKASRGIPHQVIRNIEISRACSIINDNPDNIGYEVGEFHERASRRHCISGKRCRGGEVVIGPGINYLGYAIGLPETGQYKEYTRVIADGVRYGVRGPVNLGQKDDSYVELVDGTYGKIKHIVAIEGAVIDLYVILKTLRTSNMSDVSHLKTIVGSSGLTCLPFASVKCVAVHIQVGNCEYVSSIPKNHFFLNM